MNLLQIILGQLKSLSIKAIVPIVSGFDAAAGKALSDGADAFSDSKISLEEAEVLACDAIDIAAEKLPHLSGAFAALKKNITEDVPIIASKIIPDFEATFAAFKDAAAPAA